MRRLQLIALAVFLTTACGGGDSSEPSSTSGSGTSSGSGSGSGSGAGGESGERTSSGGGGGGEGDEFQLSDSDTAQQAHGDLPSEIEANRTHAAMRLFIVDPETGPIEGIVIKMTGPDGRAYYTRPTDSVGYGEVLVPVGRRYSIEYLSLGRRATSANVDVPEGPNQDIRLTMRYRRQRMLPPEPADLPPEQEPAERAPRGFTLDGVLFESGEATISEESFERLDRVVEYMEYTPDARIRIGGHTDNVGNPQRNQALSEARAQAVRTYIVEHGIDEGRLEAVGYGDTQPVASNDTDSGRAQNRRIEAVEL